VSGEATPHPMNGQGRVWLTETMRWKSLDLHKFRLKGNGDEIAIILQNLPVWLSQGKEAK
jgi:hypothetical protein